MNGLFSTLKRWYHEYAVLARFYLLLGYFLVLQFILLHWDVSHRYLAEHLPAFIAQASVALLNLFGVAAQVNGVAITMPNHFTFQIVYHCAGPFAMIIYTAAVLAFPSTWMEKLWGLIFGIAALNAVNITRIATLGLVSLYEPRFFDYFHEYLWQGIFIIFVLFLWLVWRLKIVKSDLEPPLPREAPQVGGV